MWEFLILQLIGVGAISNIDPRQNMWVTWANQTGQDSFCLSLATPEDPFRTCLVGVPLAQMSDFGAFRGWIRNFDQTSSVNDLSTDGNMTEASVQVARRLQITGWEPQELELLGSAPAAGCVQFGYEWLYGPARA